MKKAIIAGSLDPITVGHVWVIKQAIKMFDKVYVAIGVNPEKKSSFSVEERKSMIENAFPILEYPNLEVISFQSEFLVDVCDQYGVDVMVRGIRNVQDFEYEKQIQDVNERINNRVQTVYLVPPNEVAGISSSMVKGLIGISQWQFVVGGLVPQENMSYMTNLAYSNKELDLMLQDFIDPLKVFGGFSEDGYSHNEKECKEFRKQLYSVYNATGRYYHTIQHVNEMLGIFMGNTLHMDPRAAFPCDSAILWAIIFHDYVYDPLSKTNEEDSVEAWELFANRYEFFAPMKEEVSKLIMFTKTHEAPKDEYWGEFMVDLDMAILGSSTARFNEYERQIRNEYAMVDDETYKKGRLDFVQKILARNTIYLTKMFQNTHEKQARINLNKLLEVLNGSN